MWIVALALRRPYTFVVLALLIAVMGVLSVVRMPMDIFPRINMLPHGGAAGDRPDRGRHRTVVGAWIELTRRDAEARALTHGQAGVLLRLAALGTGPTTLVLRVVGWTSIAAVCFLLGAALSRYGWLHAGRASARDPEETLAAQKGSR